MPPVQPRTPRTPASPKGPKPWKEPANWKQKTQARWLKNHPQPLFPSTDITKGELGGLLTSARQQTQKTYAASPMPSLHSYLQPFADASVRNAALGANAVNYLQGATQTAQNLTGAFQGALTGGIAAGQQAGVQQGGSGTGIPPAAQSLIPMAGVGSSYAGYLNALQPSVGAAVNETQRQLNAQQGKAAADYETAAATRRQDILDAIQKLYAGNVSTLQDQKLAANKAAVTEYLALGKTAYQKSQLAQRGSQFKTTTGLKRDQLTLGRDKLAATKSYQQSSLDLQRKKALKQTGVDTTSALKILNAPTTSTSATTTGPGKTGPVGQRGRWYTITPTSYTATGTPIEGKSVRRFVAYGETVPTAKKGPNGPTLKVTPGDYAYPSKTSAKTTGRKATPASWDAAVQHLKAKWPGKITASWLKTHFPPRPTGT